MKIETTIAIEVDLLEQVDNVAKNLSERSEVFERALKEYLPKIESVKQKRNLSEEEEIALINRFADEHSREILETLEYQIDL